MTTDQDKFEIAGDLSIVASAAGVEQWLAKEFPLLHQDIFADMLIEEFRKENPKMSREKIIQALETTSDSSVVANLVKKTRIQLHELLAIAADPEADSFATAGDALLLIISKSASMLPSPLRAEAMDKTLGALLTLCAEAATSGSAAPSGAVSTGTTLVEPILWLLSAGGDLSPSTLSKLITCLGMVMSHSQVDGVRLSRAVKEALELAFKRRDEHGMNDVILSLIDLAKACGGAQLPVLLDVIAEHTDNPDVARAAKSRARRQRGTLASVWERIVIDQVSSHQFRAGAIHDAVAAGSDQALILCICTQCKGNPIEEETDPRYQVLLSLLDHERIPVRLAVIQCLLNASSIKAAQDTARTALMRILKQTSDEDTREDAGWILVSSIAKA